MKSSLYNFARAFCLVTDVTWLWQWEYCYGVSWPSGVSALDSGVVRMWVRIPAWPVAALVSFSNTLNHNCFVLRKAVGPVCCVMHVKEPRTLIVKENGLAPVFLHSRLEHPAGWISARYKSSVLLLSFMSKMRNKFWRHRFTVNSFCENYSLSILRQKKQFLSIFFFDAGHVLSYIRLISVCKMFLR